MFGFFNLLFDGNYDAGCSLCWLRDVFMKEPWTVLVKLNGAIILPLSSTDTSPPFLMTEVSTIDWNPDPNPAYFSLCTDYFTGNTDHALNLSNLPSASPKSLVHDIHFNCFVVNIAYL